MKSKTLESMIPYGIRHSDYNELTELENHLEDKAEPDVIQIFSVPKGPKSYSTQVEELLDELEHLSLVITPESQEDRFNATVTETLAPQSSRREEVRVGREIVEEYFDIEDDLRIGATTWDYTVPRNNREIATAYPELDGPIDGFQVEFEDWNAGKDWLLNHNPLATTNMGYYIPVETGAWRSYRKAAERSVENQAPDITEYRIRDADYTVFGMTFSDDFSDYAEKFWPQEIGVREIFIEPEPTRRVLPQFWKDLGKKIGGVEDF